MLRIYLASSWRNTRQPEVLQALRAAGHETYDFRNPAPDDHGFSWRETSAKPVADWTVADYMVALTRPAAQRGFNYDMRALRGAQACVLLLPCGRSAHMEWGWAVGQGKRCFVLCEHLDEPELMYLMAGAPGNVIAQTVDELVEMLGEVKLPAAFPRAPSFPRERSAPPSEEDARPDTDTAALAAAFDSLP